MQAWGSKTGVPTWRKHSSQSWDQVKSSAIAEIGGANVDPFARSTTRGLHRGYSPEVIISLFINPVQRLFNNQTGTNSLSAHCHGPREDYSIRPGIRTDARHKIAYWLPRKPSLLSLSFRTCAGRKTKMPPNVNSVISRSRWQEERYCEHCSEDFIGSSP